MARGLSLPLVVALVAAAGGHVVMGPSDAAAPPARSAASDTERPEVVVDPAPKRVPRGRVAVAADVPADVRSLHSRPGADRTILLDVDGHEVSGSQWNSRKGLRATTYPAWPGSDASIYEVWQRVAEDYAPFDVDVTTEDPGPDALVRADTDDVAYGVRVLVTPSDEAMQTLCGGRCGGLAFLDVFDERTARPVHQPAWVFPQSLSGNAKAIAEAASHEAGHTLGLEHHGGAGTEYYAGHGAWAPIMGIGYQRPLTQWSTGSYPGATNPDQDDVATILRGGLPYAADDRGDTVARAEPLGDGAGVIGSADDVDVLDLGVCTGRVRVTATPAEVGPDLDIALTVVDASGTVVGTSDPPALFLSRESADGLDASLAADLDGRHYALVDGVGWGSPSTGYDDSGSLGAYTVTAPGCEPPGPTVPPADEPPAAPRITSVGPGPQGGPTTARVTWHVPERGDAPTTFEVTVWRLADGDRRRTTTRRVDGSTDRLAVRLRPSRYRFTITAGNDAGSSPASRASDVVRPR